MNPSLGAEQKYSLITRRLEHQNGWGSQELQSLLTNGKEIKYQWGKYFVKNDQVFVLTNQS